VGEAFTWQVQTTTKRSWIRSLQPLALSPIAVWTIGKEHSNLSLHHKFRRNIVLWQEGGQ